MRQLKPIVFRGTALNDLRDFPEAVRKQAGYQLDQIQRGRNPHDWKPMTSIGPGVREIRLSDEQGAFRVIYVAKLADAIYVLHCFKKTSQKTARDDLALAASRLKDLQKDLKP